jgi:4-hydroxy-3-polyprenylbenzoate decarboxylase
MKKIIVAVTGASGSIYAKIIINKLAAMPQQVSELGIIFTKNAGIILNAELGDDKYDKQFGKIYSTDDFSAPFASGSGQYDTMIIIPCSMGMLGRIASGISDDLITRSADVILKERRRLICVLRESPYSLIHIRNMETITLAGGIICPASPSFYSKPQTVEEAATTVVDRVLDLAGLKIDTYRWGNGEK